MTEKWREDEEYLSYVEDLLATEEVKISRIHTTYAFNSFRTFN